MPKDEIPANTNVINEYTQQSGGVLSVDLAEAAAGSFDVVSVGGTTTLDGTLRINATDGFVPSTTDPDLLFLVSADVTGDFSSIDSEEYIVAQTTDGILLSVVVA